VNFWNSGLTSADGPLSCATKGFSEGGNNPQRERREKEEKLRKRDLYPEQERG